MSNDETTKPVSDKEAAPQTQPGATAKNAVQDTRKKAREAANG